jgi:hypothetical protein
MHTPDLKRLAAVIAFSAVLGACGSSGGDDVTANPGSDSDVPAAAFDSVAGLLAYVNELIAGTNETSEPVRVGEAALPVSDTTEPVN